MGTSHPETKPWVIERIRALDLGPGDTILDIGAGAGNWLDAIRAAGLHTSVHACEIWEPYIRAYHLDQRYNRLVFTDARKLSAAVFARYNVVIFGDVLEHMTKEEAQALWVNASTAQHRAIAIPIIHYHQGALAGNPYEVHVKADWSHEEVLKTFDGITESQVFTVTGAYWA